MFGALRELFPSCFCFCVGTPEGAFLGASPELLVRRRGAGVATVALAGSTRRSADPAVDDHLGEQLLRSDKDRAEHEIVARRIERTLRAARRSGSRPSAEPGLIKVANIQHLATPDPRPARRAALGDRARRRCCTRPRRSAASPTAERSAAIAELEDLDRGWYAGPVGWMDAPRTASSASPCARPCCATAPRTCSPGAGIVADSDPAAELAETELKLEALLPLLS